MVRHGYDRGPDAQIASEIHPESRGAGSSMAPDHSSQLQACLARFQQGDRAAGEELIEAACDRLALTHNMLRGDRLRRWEETDDVLQQSLVRLHQTLANIQPETVRDFMRLAAWHIRLVLISLAALLRQPWSGRESLQRPQR